MITARDFIRLPYTPDLTAGGIAYALRSLPYTFNRMGGSSYGRMRRIIAGVAAELAFRRYLSQQEIPFAVKGAMPFTDPDRYVVLLGGHRCNLKSFLITHREQIAAMRHDPSVILGAPALVPADQNAAEGHTDNDLYLFAFLAGLVAASQDDLKKVIQARQPHYLVHAMRDEWRRPQVWHPLGPLSLKSESEEELLVEISGQGAGREFLTRKVSLPPKIKVVLDEPFYGLTSIHVNRLPEARLGILNSYSREVYLISPKDWGNIWVYGMELYFTGYVSRGEFGRCANPLHPGSRVFQYDITRKKNLAMPVSALKPLSDLFERVRVWAATEGHS